ncbi:hypothetical protein LX64_03461 [Chitinophaga skermanii]|uniref:Probable membrane transporter protein n=1 Tax=Chitinophaga skermanii TaxID=331697 RepID=A0A327QCT2_9BACT|nr:sulfite exporter TauE/SafE family protein [Chitinophaga skermanii]RAJ02446.1 hypothetical protein LX64_03461 [Chitinophaga skermanii]
MFIVGIIAAFFIGISLGMIGGGGAILTMPVLVYLLGIPPMLATTYSLFIVGVSSAVGAVLHKPQLRTNGRVIMLFGGVSMFVVFLVRKFLVPHIPTILFSNEHITISSAHVTMLLFAALMCVAGIAMLRDRAEKPAHTTKHSNSLLIIYGIATGLITGLLGAGGGFILMPALVLIIGMPIQQALGTSLFLIALNTLTGFVIDITHIDLHWTFLFFLTAIAFAGMLAGWKWGKRVPAAQLKMLFGFFLVAVAAFIFLIEMI